jgi:hypothetical protein
LLLVYFFKLVFLMSKVASIKGICACRVPNGICKFLRKKERYDLADILEPIIKNGFPTEEPSKFSEQEDYQNAEGFDLEFDVYVKYDLAKKIPSTYEAIWITAPESYPMTHWTVDVEYKYYEPLLCEFDKSMPNFFDELSKQSNNYTLTYKFTEIEIFNVHVHKIIEYGCNWISVDAILTVELCESTGITGINDTKPAN